MRMRSYSNLPEEILFDILSRLSAKSVGLCRCVSKSWRALLTRPEFIRTHLHRSRILRRESLLLLDSQRYLYSAPLRNARQLFDEITVSATKLSFADHLNSWILVLASCDGLLLVLDKQRKSFVLNPVTREIREVPRSPFALDPDVSMNMCGLGYDSVSDDYKVVTISYHFTAVDYPPGCAEMFVDVYSLKRGSWKRVESSPYDHAFGHEEPGVFVDGYIHWLGRGTTDYKSVIVAFDLLEEKFHEVPPPRSVESDELHYDQLAVLDGCLCMFDESENHIWVMKEHGVAESWTKFTINDPDCWIVCFLGKEQIVMSKDYISVMYNLKQGTLKNIVIGGISDVFHVTASFLESLISPHASHETGRE